MLVRVGGRGSARYPHRRGVAGAAATDLVTSTGPRCLWAAGPSYDWGVWSAVTWFGANKERALFAVSTVLLVAGGVAWLLSAATAANALWIAGTVLGLVFSIGWMVASIRRGQLSVDVIALLALAGALVVNEPFAGAVITVMLASGQLLEARAAARARRELSLLVAAGSADRAPPTPTAAWSRCRSTTWSVGDRLLVGTGEVVPVDGRLLSPACSDESALTGEPMPVERIAGDDVRSGVVNSGQPVDLVATATAARVHLRRGGAAGRAGAGILGAVRAGRRPVRHRVRAADPGPGRAAWLLSGDPVRAVAVLVVATPCPLLLAAPIAIMSGLSRAAHLGVIIKGGGALERLAGGRVMLFDKTGTLTQGHPVVTDVVTAGADFDADEVLRWRLAGPGVRARAGRRDRHRRHPPRRWRCSCPRESARSTATAWRAPSASIGSGSARRRGSSATPPRHGCGRSAAAPTWTGP